MNDYWNDPPEEPEVPECCEMEMECDRNGVLWCKNCGAQIEPDPEPEPIDEWKCDKCGRTYPCLCEPEPEEDQKCPHGKTSGCDHCDYLSDIAFDTHRENRLNA